VVIDTEGGENTVPKSAGKLIAARGGDIVRYTVFADHMFEEHSC
jgi:hypothetical protein